MWARRVVSDTPVVDVASSGKVPPVASNIRSAESEAAGMEIVNEPSVAVVDGPATIAPDVFFTVTLAPLVGPAKTVPDTEVDVDDEPPPPQPKSVSERQNRKKILNEWDVYEFMVFSS
jgi:hypothetical protein